MIGSRDAAGAIPSDFPREPAALPRRCCRPIGGRASFIPLLSAAQPIQPRCSLRAEEYSQRPIPSQSGLWAVRVFPRDRHLLVTVAKRRHAAKPVVLSGPGERSATSKPHKSAGSDKSSRIFDYFAAGATSTTCSTLTGTTPASFIASCSAARGDMSISSDGLTGPRSVTLTMTERPFCRFVTRVGDEFAGVRRFLCRFRRYPGAALFRLVDRGTGDRGDRCELGDVLC